MAWRLLAALRARGHNAVLLDGRSRRSDIAEWRCALRPVLPTPVPSCDRPLYREKTRKFFAALAELPCSEPFPLEQPQRMEPFDLVIVGSDEVWNPWHPWYGACRIFRGEGIRAERLVSYAASLGHYPQRPGYRKPGPTRCAASIGFPYETQTHGRLSEAASALSRPSP